MAVFNNTQSEWEGLDWAILRDGSASVYWGQRFLEEDIEWFLQKKYQAIRFDCSLWRDDRFCHQDLYDKLKLPDYYGSNYDSLNECLQDIAISNTGLVIVFQHFDALDKNRRRVLIEI